MKICPFCKGAAIVSDDAVNETDTAKLRAALVGLVGTDGKEDLEKLELIMRMASIPEKDRAILINAIHALMDTL